MFSDITREQVWGENKGKKGPLLQKLLVHIVVLLNSQSFYNSVELYIGKDWVCGVEGKNGYGGTAAQGE